MVQIEVFRQVLPICTVFLLMVCAGNGVYAAEAPEPRPDLASKYIRTPTGFLMVLRRGDDVLDYLRQLARQEHIPSASLSGMGFVNATFGFWDAQQKKFQPREFKSVEAANLTGTIAWEGGEPSIHAHAVVAGPDFEAHGGHVLAMQVDTGSFEITVTVHDRQLQRAKDSTLDAKVLVLPSAQENQPGE